MFVWFLCGLLCIGIQQYIRVYSYPNGYDGVCRAVSGQCSALAARAIDCHGVDCNNRWII